MIPGTWYPVPGTWGTRAAGNIEVRCSAGNQCLVLCLIPKNKYPGTWYLVPVTNCNYVTLLEVNLDNFVFHDFTPKITWILMEGSVVVLIRCVSVFISALCHLYLPCVVISSLCRVWFAF